jgi:hypothetical protein
VIAGLETRMASVGGGSGDFNDLNSEFVFEPDDDRQPSSESRTVKSDAVGASPGGGGRGGRGSDGRSSGGGLSNYLAGWLIVLLVVASLLLVLWATWMPPLRDHARPLDRIGDGSPQIGEDDDDENDANPGEGNGLSRGAEGNSGGSSDGSSDNRAADEEKVESRSSSLVSEHKIFQNDATSLEYWRASMGWTTDAEFDENFIEAKRTLAIKFAMPELLREWEQPSFLVTHLVLNRNVHNGGDVDGSFAVVFKEAYENPSTGIVYERGDILQRGFVYDRESGSIRGYISAQPIKLITARSDNNNKGTTMTGDGGIRWRISRQFDDSGVGEITDFEIVGQNGEYSFKQL